MGDAEVRSLHTVFDSFDKDGSGSIDIDELTAATASLGISTTREKLLAMFQEADTDRSATITFDEFVEVVHKGKSGTAATFTDVVTKGRESLLQVIAYHSMLPPSSPTSTYHPPQPHPTLIHPTHPHTPPQPHPTTQNRTPQQYPPLPNPPFLLQVKKDHTVHTFAHEECLAFVNLINRKLEGDPDLAYVLPIPTDDVTELFKSIIDGVILCKLINIAGVSPHGLGGGC